MALYKPPTQNALQYTLDSQIAAGATSLTLNSSVTGIVQAPGVLVIDRIDSSGNSTPSKREYKTFTGVSGANITGLAGGLAGSTDQIHAVGAIVEFVPDIIQQQAIYDAITAEHSTGGVHTSLASIGQIRALGIVGWSAASLNDLQVGTRFGVSGASLVGFPIHPTWVISGAVSAATTAVGKPLDMPQDGTIQYASVVLRSPVSGASLLIDINKNFTSVFEAGTRLSILGGGTFASTASIFTKPFNAGDVFSVDIDAGGSFQDAVVKFRAR